VTKNNLKWQVPTNWVLYTLVTPAGFMLWVIGIIKLWRKNPVENEVTNGS